MHTCAPVKLLFYFFFFLVTARACKSMRASCHSSTHSLRFSNRLKGKVRSRLHLYIVGFRPRPDGDGIYIYISGSFRREAQCHGTIIYWLLHDSYHSRLLVSRTSAFRGHSVHSLCSRRLFNLILHGSRRVAYAISLSSGLVLN